MAYGLCVGVVDDHARSNNYLPLTWHRVPIRGLAAKSKVANDAVGCEDQPKCQRNMCKVGTAIREAL